MFGLFKRRPKLIGQFTIRVFQPNSRQVSVEYNGSPINRADGLWLRGLYAAKWLFTASDADTTAAVLASMAAGARKLHEDKDLGVAKAVGVELVPNEKAAYSRHKIFTIIVYKGPDLDKPLIQTNLPSDTTLGDVVATIAAFNDSWLSNYGIKPEGFGVRSYLQFCEGFLDYYYSDPLAYTSPESIYQAALKAELFAMSTALGLMGMVEDQA